MIYVGSVVAFDFSELVAELKFSEPVADQFPVITEHHALISTPSDLTSELDLDDADLGNEVHSFTEEFLSCGILLDVAMDKFFRPGELKLVHT